MANEMLSNIIVQRLNTAASPNSYQTLENPMSGVTVGQTQPLVDVTNLSDTARRYISGLEDGDEFSIECAATHASPSVQQLFISLNGTTQTLRITSTRTEVSPNTIRYYSFEAVFLGWSLTPSVGEADKLTFNFKISGAITRTQG